MTAELRGATRATRVMQMTSHHDTILVLISDRQTEFAIPPGDTMMRRDVRFPIIPSLQLTYSPLGFTPQRDVLRIPILVPTVAMPNPRGPVLLTRADESIVLDSISLGARVVRVDTRDGPALLYDSPMRVLHDVGTRLAISGDGSVLVSVDTKERGDAVDLDIRLVPLDWASSRSMARWSVALPLVKIGIDEWLAARDSTVRTMTSQFANAETAADALGKLVRPGDMLPAVRSVRASQASVLVELHTDYAMRSSRARMLFVTAGGSCGIGAEREEHVVAVGRREIWTVAASQGRGYVQTRGLCEPRR